MNKYDRLELPDLVKETVRDVITLGRHLDWYEEGSDLYRFCLIKESGRRLAELRSASGIAHGFESLPASWAALVPAKDEYDFTIDIPGDLEGYVSLGSGILVEGALAEYVGVVGTEPFVLTPPRRVRVRPEELVAYGRRAR